ncbi:metal-dependent hydrolase [Acinetobacter baumannii]|uniref:metal-dependent hydrolase n=1 Tax=Acinetobacter baumannii TaxID=470 RepID=UPI00321BE87E
MLTIPSLASTVDWPLFPRKVKFDWSQSPLHWIPQSPFASHVVNQFGFSLVRGEYFFCRTFNKALPLIQDEKLRKDVETFIRQEAIHAQAHKEAIEQYLQKYGVDIVEQYAKTQYLFDQVLADKPFGINLPRFIQKQWLLVRVGIVAAAEHYTCAIGQYVLEHSHWEARGADPAISDLFTWHCAEEVEHRTVAYDLYQHLSGSYAMRAGIMLGVGPALTYLVAAGTVKLANTDETIPKSHKRLTSWKFWREWQKAHQDRLAPGPIWFLTQSLRFFKPNYHPYQEGSTELALAYINKSPAVLAHQHITAQIPSEVRPS